MRLLNLFICIIFSTLFAVQAFAENEFKIFTLQHRFAEDLLPTIKPMVGNEGTASGIQNQVIVRASHDRMVEIEQIVDTLDVTRQNLKITVKRQNNARFTDDNFIVNGRKRIGNVQIGTYHYPRNTRDGVEIDINNNQANSNNLSNQFINVGDGGQAYISIGQSVPFTQEWITFTRKYVHVQQTTQFIDVSTGFTVSPRLVGNQIELQVTPRLAQLNNSGTIDFEELSTTVMVNRGEWVDLGGILQQKDEVSRAILNSQSSISSQNNQLSIRVD